MLLAEITGVESLADGVLLATIGDPLAAAATSEVDSFLVALEVVGFIKESVELAVALRVFVGLLLPAEAAVAVGPLLFDRLMLSVAVEVLIGDELEVRRETSLFDRLEQKVFQ